MRARGDREPNGTRTNLLEMSGQESRDLLGLLVRHQSAGDLGAGPRGNNRLGSGSLVAAGDTVDLEGRSSPASFERREAPFARERRHAKEAGVSAVVKR